MRRYSKTKKRSMSSGNRRGLRVRGGGQGRGRRGRGDRERGEKEKEELKM